ncbi:NAD-dependent protein deacetylase of SIR2 family [Alkalibacterium sp. AK22]|uniref:NAD-dependent protein deacylase n=1 Tax=Alkalibacterium sp. AK22 TaxID=1229520 RepID=UPI00044F0857|nr:NAD-dependent protein deacylase [Alkalibacterium sp. AK22]EXJ23490.1 NAD-dependent protein deacetylase of SIR2 family [Alkalibacterium sp. AK22]
MYKTAAKWLAEAKKTVVITGAGISTESGIPDFRSGNGLYNQKMKGHHSFEEVLSRTFFNEQPELFYQFYLEHLLHPNAEPNPGHYFLEEMEQSGTEVTVITQNIDGLHQRAGSRRIIELHGNAGRVRTQQGHMYDIKEAVKKKASWEVAGKWVRPDIVLYGEMLDPLKIEESIEAVKAADTLLVMGTSLNVYPAAGLLYEYTGSRSVLVNKEPTRLDRRFALSFPEDISSWALKIRKWI